VSLIGAGEVEWCEQIACVGVLRAPGDPRTRLFGSFPTS
jgi:hypothetical protein